MYADTAQNAAAFTPPEAAAPSAPLLAEVPSAEAPPSAPVTPGPMIRFVVQLERATRLAVAEFRTDEAKAIWGNWSSCVGAAMRAATAEVNAAALVQAGLAAVVSFASRLAAELDEPTMHGGS